MLKNFAIIGRKGTGRSDVLLALVTILKSRGYRVGVVRHLQRDDLEIDQPGKDTYEYRMQGAQKVILSGRKRCAVFENRDEELSVEELLKSFDGYDFVFFEEYFSADLPTIEIHKQAAGERLPEKMHRRIALCSDSAPFEALRGEPFFSPEEVPLLADFLESFEQAKEKGTVLPC